MSKIYIHKFMFINIFYIFYILRFVFCDSLSLDEFKRMITKNESRNWLDNWNVTNSSNPYCQLCCINILAETIGKRCGSHTLCKYPTKHTGPACKGYVKIGFTKDEKITIVDAHNTLRNIVASGLERRGNSGPQPKAANMRLLIWNDELAMIAERWAAQCIYAHDVCRDLERFPVGQNIARGNVATNNELSFIKAWYDEVRNFSSSEVEQFELPPQGNHTSHRYVQLVWADTYEIGCARAIFQRSSDSKVLYREHFICNYGPSGNIPNQPVYIIGSPCTFCPDGTGCTLEYPSLCGAEYEIRRENVDENKNDDETVTEIGRKLEKYSAEGVQNLHPVNLMLLFSFTLMRVL